MSDNQEIITGATGHPPRQRGSLTITVGLPGSGKSTWGAEMQTLYPDRVRIVNRDDIRASIGTQYPQDEPLVAQIRDFTIDKFLTMGYDVICTDTNISPKVRRRLAGIAKTRKAECTETSFMHVPVEVCVERNEARWAAGDHKVPTSAIHRMYQDFVKLVDVATKTD